MAAKYHEMGKKSLFWPQYEYSNEEKILFKVRIPVSYQNDYSKCKIC